MGRPHEQTQNTTRAPARATLRAADGRRAPEARARLVQRVLRVRGDLARRSAATRATT